jgi:hypothetical protein
MNKKHHPLRKINQKVVYFKNSDVELKIVMWN